MVLTLERPTETQTNPHFNPEIPMDQLARSIFNDSHSFDLRHSGLINADAAVIFQTDGTDAISPNTTLFYGEEKPKVVPKSDQPALPLIDNKEPSPATYRWQLSDKDSVSELSVNDQGQLVGWQAIYDPTRRLIAVEDLDQKELLAAWTVVSHIMRSAPLEDQVKELRSQKIQKEVALAKFLSTRETRVIVPVDQLSSKAKVVARLTVRETTIQGMLPYETEVDMGRAVIQLKDDRYVEDENGNLIPREVSMNERYDPSFKKVSFRKELEKRQSQLAKFGFVTLQLHKKPSLPVS